MVDSWSSRSWARLVDDRLRCTALTFGRRDAMAINRARNGLSIFGSPVINGVAKSNAPFYSVIATLPWSGHFTPAPAQFSHSIAADSVYNHSFVPVSNVGVLVFADDNGFGNGQNGQ